MIGLFQENQDKTIGSFSKMIGDIRRPDVISMPAYPRIFAPSGTRVLNFSKFEDNVQLYHLESFNEEFVLILSHFV